MSNERVTLHMVCGKVAAGKSTLAADLAATDGTALIAEDAWLAALYGDQMSSLQDYVRFSARLRSIMGPHVASLLQAGLSVVLDFPANTRQTRLWMREIVETAGAAHQLHVLTTPDALCLERLHRRNAAGDHPFAATEEQFRQISKHFEPPAPDEGFDLVIQDQANGTV